MGGYRQQQSTQNRTAPDKQMLQDLLEGTNCFYILPFSLYVFSSLVWPQRSQSILFNYLYFSLLPQLGAGNLLIEALSIILFPLFPSSSHFSVECALSYGAYCELLVFYAGPRAVCIHSEYECSSFMGKRRKILVHFSFCPCCKTNV